jgi:hypothetical protein
MNTQHETDTTSCESLARLEQHVRCLLVGRVRDFQLVVVDDGLVLRGVAHTYHVKQMAQQAVMERSGLPIRANEIEVCCPARR